MKKILTHEAQKSIVGMTDAEMIVEIGNSLHRRLVMAREAKNIKLCIEIEDQLSNYCSAAEMLDIREATIKEIVG